MNSIDEFKNMVGGYFGIQEMDEYPLKEYVLKEIEDYIKKYLNEHKDLDVDLYKLAEDVNTTLSLKRKLQDALLILKKISRNLELELLVKRRLSDLKNEIV